MKKNPNKLIALIVATLSCSILHAQEVNTGTTEISTGIIGGEIVTAESYPWMVTLTMTDGTQGCGASLIHPEWVLTAGHCYINFPGEPSIDKVIINSLIIDPDALESYSELINVEEIITHEDYSGVIAGGTGPDLALIRLSSPAITTPVALATTEYASFYSANQPAKALGWGKTEAGGENVDSLRIANCIFISEDTCGTLYAAAGSGSVYEANSGGNICAGFFSGSTPVGAAQGDSGGPLFFEDADGNYRQVGIVSGGNSDITTENFPGVFTFIPKYKEWIDSVINSYESSATIKVLDSETLNFTYFANNYIEISGLTDHNQYTINLFDLAGNLMNTFSPGTENSTVKISVSNYRAGLYLTQVINQTNGQITTKKIVLE